MDFEAAESSCHSFPGCAEDTKRDHDTVFSVDAISNRIAPTDPIGA